MPDDVRRHPPRPIVSVGGVVIRDDRVALVQRRHPPLQGAWSLPGGVVDVGETLESAVAREVYEETGLVVDVGPVVEVLDRIHRDDHGRVEYHYVIIDYLCAWREGELASASDAAAAQWVTVADLDHLRPSGDVRAVVIKALAQARARDRGGATG